jgi:hypothetical protein
MNKLYQVLLVLFIGSTPAMAQTCPGTPTACPSPTYNALTVGGALTAGGGGTLGGSYAGTPTLTGSWNFSAGLSGTLTGTATFNLLLAGGTLTGNLTVPSLSVGATAQTFPASGNIVGTTDTQTLTNKSISGSEINSGTVAAARGGAGTVTGALKGNGAGAVSQAACADLSNGGTACAAAIPAVGIVQSSGTALGDVTVSTGLTYTSPTLSSNAVTFISFSPGPATSISSTKGAFYKATNAMTFDNIEGSALAFICGTNPTVTFYECGTSTTCASPTVIGTVTVTASGTVVDGTIAAAAVTAGDYVAAGISAGVCTSLNIVATAQLHAN